MLIVIDGDWRTRVQQCNSFHELLIVTPHHRRHLPRMRAVMDGVSRAWDMNAAEIDQAWMLSIVHHSKTVTWRQKFGDMVAELWKLGRVNESDGFIRVPVKWGIDISALQPERNGESQKCHRVRVDDVGKEFTCVSESSLLHGCVFAGHNCLPSGCHGGGCGICKIRVLEGKYWCGTMSRQHVSEEDIARGAVLACRTYPLSDLVIELDGKAAKRAKRTNPTTA